MLRHSGMGSEQHRNEDILASYMKRFLYDTAIKIVSFKVTVDKFNLRTIIN